MIKSIHGVIAKTTSAAIIGPDFLRVNSSGTVGLSDDEGSSWTVGTWPNGTDSLGNQEGMIDGVDGTFYAVSRSGTGPGTAYLYSSVDGDNWTSEYSWAPTGSLEPLVVGKDGDGRVMAILQDDLIVADSGSGFATVTNPASTVQGFGYIPGAFIAFCNNATVYHMADGETTWTAGTGFSSSLPVSSTTKVVGANAASGIFTLSDQDGYFEVWRSTNSGSSWTRVVRNNVTYGYNAGPSAGNGTIFVASSMNQAGTVQTIWYSTNGTTWNNKGAFLSTPDGGACKYAEWDGTNFYVGFISEVDNNLRHYVSDGTDVSTWNTWISNDANYVTTNIL